MHLQAGLFDTSVNSICYQQKSFSLEMLGQSQVSNSVVCFFGGMWQSIDMSHMARIKMSIEDREMALQ